MPDDFPASELALFMAACRHVLLRPQKGAEWKEFAGATNLIGWRFRASSESWLSYKRSWHVSGAAVSHEEIYAREKDLFGMFSAGVSCMDSTAYAIAALASHPKILSLTFGANEQRRCSLARLNQWLAALAPHSGLSQVVATACASSEWKLWVDLRNRMSHRSNLPRVTYGSMGAPLPPAKALNFAATSSTSRVEGDMQLFDALHAWLAETLRDLLKESAAICPP